MHAHVRYVAFKRYIVFSNLGIPDGAEYETVVIFEHQWQPAQLIQLSPFLR